MSNTFDTPKLPEVKFNKNGYEIRTDVLAMAKDAVMDEYHMKFKGWEMSVERDAKLAKLSAQLTCQSFQEWKRSWKRLKSSMGSLMRAQRSKYS